MFNKYTSLYTYRGRSNLLATSPYAFHPWRRDFTFRRQ